MNPETQAKPKSKNNLFWPDVSTLDKAQWASRQAFWAASFCAVVTALLSGLAISGNAFAKGLHLSAWSLLDASTFGVIALGLWKQSRVAATAGLAFYVFEQAYAMMTMQRFGNPIMVVVFTFAFIAGVRGTYARARLLKEPDPTGSMSQAA